MMMLTKTAQDETHTVTVTHYSRGKTRFVMDDGHTTTTVVRSARAGRAELARLINEEGFQLSQMPKTA